MSLAISIIIPAFNIAEYLTACLDSIVYQVNDEVEVIIVNDGSTDNTGNVANSYAFNYDFIKVLHQSNQGVSAARNRGLIEAQGAYVWFIDGDDLIADNALNALITNLHHYDVDIVFFRYHNFYRFPDSTTSVQQPLNTHLKAMHFESWLPKLLKFRHLSYSACDKIIKRHILLNNNITFKTTLKAAEDYYWNYEVFRVLKSFIFIDEIFYHYRKSRVGSATTVNSKGHLFATLQALESSVNEITSNTNKSNAKTQLLYSSQLFFYNLPEFYKSGLIDKEIEQRFFSIYNTYQMHQVPLSDYNSGAKTFDKLYRVLPWHYAIRLYSQLINIRRHMQSILLEKTK